MELEELVAQLSELASPAKANASTRFFKTGPGQYAAGDTFIGVTNPELRKLARKYNELALSQVQTLLNSKIHEERSLSLIILVNKYRAADESLKKAIYDLYIANTVNINNWDLVDMSAEYIVGPWLDGKDKAILQTLSKSEDIWERRISILATFYYIKLGNATETLKIAKLLIDDQHDLIQKAVGWMLREIGKRCSMAEEQEFLALHYKTMPRTALRYAIERFPAALREDYLKGRI